MAVKVIEAAGASRRVLREAQAAARLNHPGIVTLYELGERNGHAFLVSELVEGPPSTSWPRSVGSRIGTWRRSAPTCATR